MLSGNVTITSVNAVLNLSYSFLVHFQQISINNCCEISCSLKNLTSPKPVAYKIYYDPIKLHKSIPFHFLFPNSFVVLFIENITVNLNFVNFINFACCSYLQTYGFAQIVRIHFFLNYLQEKSILNSRRIQDLISYRHIYFGMFFKNEWIGL